MNIGALDRYITIQYQSTTQSSTTGEVTSTWTTLANVYATVNYPKSQTTKNETYEQQRETMSVPVEFVIWYRSDVTPAMRILWDSEYYDIQRINRVGQRDEMLKIVTEKKY